ncbi:MAG: hypothetical protein CMF80_03955 [Candidatus Marinimicrobia bacterium]|nr:hypothetical protein [Candidatus Neomarinimicrobiota bacterium]|tara:strand:+ start:2251 stop:3564 length:1314 start_codon:yes stop_codon:yes gene_type:complete
MFIINLVKIEKFLFLTILFFLFIPLSINIQIIHLYLWNIPLFLMFFLYFKRLLKKNKIHFKIDLWYFSILLLIISLFAATIIGKNFKENLPHLFQFISSIFFSIYVRNNFNIIINIKQILIFSIIALSVQSFIGLFQNFTQSQFGNIKSYFGSEIDNSFDVLDSSIIFSRVLGTLDQPNILGNWIVALFPFVVYSLYNEKKYNFSNILYYLSLISIFLSFFCLLLTFSIGNIAIFIFLLIVSLITVFFKKIIYLNFYKFKIPTLNILFLSFATILGGIFFSYDKIISLYDAVYYRVELKQDSVKQEASTSFRTEMNKSAILYFINYPFFGSGYNNSKFIYSKVNTNIPNRWDHRVHNIYLAFLVEGGIFAFIGYIFFTIIPLIKIIFLKDQIKFPFIFTLLACLAFIQIYLTPTAAEFTPLYSIFLGSSMGLYDQES